MIAPQTVAEENDRHRCALAAIRSEALDDLLSRWDHWLNPVRVSRGYGASSAGSFYRTSRQYDDQNGALDDAVEHSTMQGVQACIERLQEQHRVAIHIEARNLRLGLSLWRSPRLPANQVLAREITMAARASLTDKLVAAGLIE